LGKRILVLSAGVGGGHVRAGQAVEAALRELDGQANVRHIDVLTLTNATFRRVYAQTYFDLVAKAPHVAGYIYDALDKPRPKDSRRDGLRLMVEKLNLLKFAKLLRQEPPDVIVNTHFLPAGIIAGLRRAGKLDTPQMVVTTDFEVHRLWVMQQVERYCTATAEGKACLENWGVAAESIRVTGIPIHPVFGVAKPQAACRARLGLDGARPVVLQLAGGFGVGPMRKIFEAILSIEMPLQVVVVAGKNDAARRELEGVQAPERHRVKIMGFTDQIDELMAAADLVVTKPGGLTSSEVLARGAAMAIVNPIPGQESRNADYLLENGAAVKINNIATLAHKLGPLLADPRRLEQLKAAARRIAKPQAAFEVAREALGMA
jgi:processive 1,2-diacylglycerol beta-glucosyltransferase